MTAIRSLTNLDDIQDKAKSTHNTILQYIKKENISGIPFTKNHLYDSRTQGYHNTEENIFYILSDNHSKAINDIITSFEDKEIVEKVFKRRPKIIEASKNLHKELYAKVWSHVTQKIVYKNLLLQIPQELFNNVITRILSHMTNANMRSLIRTDNIRIPLESNLCTFPLNTLVLNLGAMVLEVIMQYVCFSKSSAKFSETLYVKNGKYENISLSSHEAKKLLQILKEAKGIPSYIEYKKYLSYKISTLKELKIFRILVQHYIDFPNNVIIEEIKDNDDYKFIHSEVISDLGGTIINAFVKLGIAKHLVLDIDEEHKNIPHVTFDFDISTTITLPLSLNKPALTKPDPVIRSQKTSIIDTPRMQMFFGYEKNTKNSFQKHCEKIEAKPILYDALEQADAVPFIIVQNTLNKLINLYESALLKIAQKDYISKEILLFVKTVFLVDFSIIDEYEKNNPYTHKKELRLVEATEVLQYACDLDKSYDFVLFVKIKNDAFLKDAYNKITARKFYFRIALYDALV